MAAVRPSWRGLELWSWKLAVTELQQGLSSAASQRVSSVLPATSLLPGSTLRQALPACPYHQPPDIPAGTLGKAERGRKPRRPSRVKEGPVSLPGPPYSPTFLSPLPFLLFSFTPFLPPSFSFSSPTFHPLPSWACAFDNMTGQSA